MPRNTIVQNMQLNSHFESLLKLAAGVTGFPRNLQKVISLAYYRNFKPKVRSKYQHLYPMLHDKGSKKFLVEKNVAFTTALDLFGYNKSALNTPFSSHVAAIELGVSDYYFRRRFCENLDDAFFELYFLYRLKKNLKFFFSEFEYMDARVFPAAWLHEYTLDFIKYSNIFSLIWYRIKQLACAIHATICYFL